MHSSTSWLRKSFAALALLFALSATAAPRIWFVDNGRTEGDGSLAAPVPTIAAAWVASAEGDVIYVRRGTGPYRESITLRERQLLVGEGIDITAQLREREIAAPASLPLLAAMPVIESGSNDAVTLASNSGVAGLLLRTTSGRALVALNASGVIAIDRVAASTADGIAVSIEGGDATIAFDASPLSATNGAAIAVSNRSGGTIAFRNGSTITVTAGRAQAITLQDNRGELLFGDALQLTTSGACALCIANSGRVAITAGTSSISTALASPITINGTALDVYLKNVSGDAATAKIARGISLDDTTGTFRIDGGTLRNYAERGISITRATGVSLQAVSITKSAADAKIHPLCSDLGESKEVGCHAAVYLQEASDVTLKDVRIDGSGQAGIFGDRVTNLTLDQLTISGAGDEIGEHGIAIRNLLGKSVFFGVTITDSAARQIFIANREGEGTLEIRKSRLDGGPPPHGGQGLLVQLGGKAKLSVVVDDSDLVEHFSDAVHALAQDQSELDLVVNGNRVDRSNSAVNLVVDRDARLQYRITNNVITNSASTAINMTASLAGGASNGTIADNIIGKSGVANSGAKCSSCGGIRVAGSRGGSSSLTVRSNTIQQVPGFGIRVQTAGTAALRAAITGNTIRQPQGSGVMNAISIQSGTRPADTAQLCIDVSGNTIAGAWDPQGGGAAITLTNKGSAAVSIAGSTGGSDAEALSSYLRTRNNGAATTVVGSSAAAKSCF